MASNLIKVLLWIFLLANIAYPGLTETTSLTLEEAVERAAEHSPSARQAENRYLSEYWNHRAHKADYRPQLELDAGIPNFNRNISGVIQPDGREEFRERSLLRNSLGLSLNQRIPYTGGDIFINTDLERLDNYQPQELTEYRTTPVTIGLRQPISGFNPYSWERDIRPLRYEEARRNYREEMESVHREAVNAFFDAFLAKINLEIAETNVANNDTLYEIAQGRYDLGKIAENELLQMELSLLNSRNAVAEAEIAYDNRLFDLKNLLEIDEGTELDLQIEHETPEVEVGRDEAVQKAKSNRREPIAYERRKKEAERDVDQAQSRRYDLDLFATYGLSNRSAEPSAIYDNPGEQQQFTLGLQMPILDWGKNKARREIAKSERDLVQTQIEQERRDFEKEVEMQVRQFRMNRNNLQIAARADTVAQKRFEVARQRYMTGKITITDLNIAMNEEERARQDYVQALRSFWTSYYNLRQLTLYDFREDEPLPLPDAPQ